MATTGYLVAHLRTPIPDALIPKSFDTILLPRYYPGAEKASYLVSLDNAPLGAIRELQWR